MVNIPSGAYPLTPQNSLKFQKKSFFQVSDIADINAPVSRAGNNEIRSNETSSGGLHYIYTGKHPVIALLDAVALGLPCFAWSDYLIANMIMQELFTAVDKHIGNIDNASI